MTKLVPKKVITVLVIVVALFLLYTFIWPAIGKSAAAAHLRQVQSQATGPLVAAVSALMQGAHPKNSLECEEVRHSHTKVQLYCQNVQVYKYNPAAFPDSSRAQVVVAATVLDKMLLQNGWTIDRPQDKIQTVVGSIPSSPRDSNHSGGVPFHKNIGDISCNLTVSFGGPTDGISPGVISINRFACQQNVSYFMLHTSDYTNHGFGG